MTPGIVLPLLALPIALLLVWRWYHRSIRAPGDVAAPEISAVRLTAEALHRVGTPEIRVVYEIGDQLIGADHVVVARPGIVAIRTIARDRPTLQRALESTSESALVAESAMTRGAVDELLGAGNGRCDLMARVYWGTTDPQRYPAEDAVHATIAVEGQRLEEWLDDWVAHAPIALDRAQVDRAWQGISLGLGCPDPLA